MMSRFGMAMLVAVGILIGFALNSTPGTKAASSAALAAAVDEPSDRDALAQLKEIKTHLKEINTLLHTGSIKVIVVINPDSSTKQE